MTAGKAPGWWGPVGKVRKPIAEPSSDASREEMINKNIITKWLFQLLSVLSTKFKGVTDECIPVLMSINMSMSR